MNLLNRLLALLAKRQVTQQNRRIKAQRIHILTRRRKHLARLGQHRALRLGLGGRNDVRDAHELEQALALGIVLAGDADGAPRKLFNVLGRARLLGLLEALLRRLLALEALRQLARLELGRGAVKDVERLDAIVHHAQRAVEHAHQV